MVILRKGSRDYGQPSVVGMLIFRRFNKTSRGTELLDELTQVLPALPNFTEEEDLDFAATITALNRYLVELKCQIKREETGSKSKFIRVLNRMFVSYCQT